MATKKKPTPKRTKHICPSELMSLHDPAECPACERVANGEPALGYEPSYELSEAEVLYIVTALQEGELIGPSLAEKINGCKVFLVQPDAIVTNPGRGL